MRLLLTHGGDSNHRIREGLDDHDVACVEFDVSGRTYDLRSDVTVEADVGLVYPSRLMEGGVLDALSGVPWVNGAGEVLLSRNKAACIARVARAGLRTPDSVLVSNPVDRDEAVDVFEAVGGDVVVKPNSATRGRGAVRVDDLDSYLGVVEQFDVLHESSLVGDRSYLVQEFVDDAVDYRVMVVGGEYAGAVRRESAGWRRNVHSGASAVAVDPPADVVDCALDAARALDVAFAGIDVLDAEEPLFLECNARPTVDDVSKYVDGFYGLLADVVRSALER
ncbi:MAG: ATP-grasp domain-containing protein [Halobacteriota archaeon]